MGWSLLTIKTPSKARTLVGRRGGGLLCYPGSELRLLTGRREKRRAKTINGMGKKSWEEDTAKIVAIGLKYTRYYTTIITSDALHHTGKYIVSFSPTVSSLFLFLFYKISHHSPTLVLSWSASPLSLYRETVLDKFRQKKGTPHAWSDSTGGVP